MYSRYREIILVLKKDRFVYSNELNNHHYFAGDPAQFNPHTIIANEKHCMFPDQPRGTKDSLKDMLNDLKKKQKSC